MKFFWVLALLLFGCIKEQKWSLQHVKSKKHLFDSSRLCYRTADRVNGIDIAIIHIKKKSLVYLEVHAQRIPPYLGDEKKAHLKFLSKNKEYLFQAERHTGGQRVALPNEIQDRLIELLKSSFSLTIELDGYRETIDPSSFELLLRKLDQPFYHLPFHLSF